MAVLIEQLNLIVRVRTLDRKYPGGLVQYRRDTLGLGFCCDGLITRVGSDSHAAVDALLESLKEKGFETVDEFGFRDAAIVDEHDGLSVGCFWLMTGRRGGGPSYAYLPESDPHACIAVPTGWSLERSDEEPSGRAAPAAQLLFLRRDGSSNVFLDRRSGQEVRIPLSAEGPHGRVIN